MYQEWVDALPDLSWIGKYKPNNEDWESIRLSLLSVRDKLSSFTIGEFIFCIRILLFIVF